MANKTAVGVLGVIVLVSMGVGILIGMQLGGPGSGPGVSPEAGDEGGTPTPIPTSGPDTPSAERTASPDPERTTVAPRRFDRAEIADQIERRIKAERVDRGLEPVQTTGRTVGRLEDMARQHSVAMADAGRVAHEVNGTDSPQRYRAADLYDTCKFESSAGTYIIGADGSNLEVLTTTVAGRQYEYYGDQRFNRNESDVADAVVQKLFATQRSRERLTYENARSVGVGVEITREGTVYVTGNVC